MLLDCLHPFSLCVILPVVSSDKEVKHIKVHQNQNGSFYLEQSQMFQSLENLVEHYRRNSLRSGTRLTRPCTRVRERNKKEKENAESHSCNNSVIIYSSFQICMTLFLQYSPKGDFWIITGYTLAVASEVSKWQKKKKKVFWSHLIAFCEDI